MMNVFEASVAAGVKALLFAPSACVYPEALQTYVHANVLTRESDVWSHGPPRQRGFYGVEKLNSEVLVQTKDRKIIVKIARFHNVYRPEGGAS